MLPLIVVSALACGLCAPLPERFVERYGGAEFDRGVHVSPTSDGGFAVVGVTRSFGHGGDDVYLVRTDSAGAVLWSRAYGGPGTDNGWSVLETADGFLLAGYTQSFGAGGYDFYVVRTDGRGDVRWSRTYGGAGDDLCWALSATRDGGFLLAGETTGSGAGEEDFLLVRIDGDGNELWSRTHGGPAGDRCFAVAPASDGGFMLAGQTYSYGAGDRDAYVVKTDRDGQVVWTRTFGGAASDVGHGISRTADGAFVMTGYTTSFATAGDDPLLVKIDEQGALRWRRVIPLAGRNHTLTGEEDEDGGFFLVGFTEYVGTGETAALLVKTDPAGQLLWQQEVLPTIPGESFGYTVRAVPGGGCVFTGHTTVGSAGGRDVLLVSLDDA